MDFRNKKPTGWQWPLIIVGLLLIPVVGNIVLVMKATGDPSFVIEEDYYRKAVSWDQTMEQEKKNRQLGWTVELTTLPEIVGGEFTTVSMALRDSDGSVIPDALVDVAVFHNARASRVVKATAAIADDGVYKARLDLRKSGLHEFQVEATRGSDVFTYKTQQDVWVGTRRGQH